MMEILIGIIIAVVVLWGLLLLACWESDIYTGAAAQRDRERQQQKTLREIGPIRPEIRAEMMKKHGPVSNGALSRNEAWAAAEIAEAGDGSAPGLAEIHAKLREWACPYDPYRD